MKFFQNKKALTLIELVISIAISAVLILIVSFFITKSLEEMNNSIVKTDSIDKWFHFKDTLNRYIRWWYNYFTLYWDSGLNNSLLIENDDSSKWFLFWVINNNTKKIQKEYIYWDNFLWYKSLSKTELNDIKTNSWVIYNYIFHDDKIFTWMRVKDFKWELYNWGDILNIDMSIVNKKDEYGFWQNINDVFIDQRYIFQFYLVF